jgi:hypothetical protein
MDPAKNPDSAKNLETAKAMDQGDSRDITARHLDLVPKDEPLVGVLTADEIHQLEHSTLSLGDAIRAIESSEG